MLIVALDTPDLPKAEHLARQLSGKASAFKVGLTLFNAYGPEAIAEIAQHGPVFCDLKLHDIPHQVSGAAAELVRQGVWMFTVHASGGSKMVAAATEAASGTKTLVAGVTVLTSLDDDALGTVGQPAASEQVERLAKLAVASGARAIVCSAHEVEMLRRELGPDVVLVVPGVRPEGDDEGDQARVMTPSRAISLGASYIVVGRPITGAADPVGAAERILASL